MVAYRGSAFDIITAIFEVFSCVCPALLLLPTCTQTHAYTCTHKHIHTHAHTHAHAHTHTHTHTHTQPTQPTHTHTHTHKLTNPLTGIYMHTPPLPLSLQHKWRVLVSASWSAERCHTGRNNKSIQEGQLD